MRKICLLFVTLFMTVMVSCSEGVDVNKCEKIADKDAASITVSDLEFLADQFLILYDDYSKASDQAKWESQHSKEIESVMDAYLSASFKFIESGKEIPSSVENKMDKIAKKMRDC